MEGLNPGDDTNEQTRETKPITKENMYQRKLINVALMIMIILAQLSVVFGTAQLGTVYNRCFSARSGWGDPINDVWSSWLYETYVASANKPAVDSKLIWELFHPPMSHIFTKLTKGMVNHLKKISLVESITITIDVV